MDPLFDRISALTREEAMEAAVALQDSFGNTTDGDTEYVADVKPSPNAHLSEVEDLARMVLLTGAVDPSLRPSVEGAVDAVGRRAFIFGGAEIVALATPGVFLFTSLQSGGKASEKEQNEIKPDGTITVSKENGLCGR
jgi:hypothetical protein